MENLKTDGMPFMTVEECKRCMGSADFRRRIIGEAVALLLDEKGRLREEEGPEWKS